MNALIPVFVAVLLAEIGGTLAIFGRDRRAVAGLAMFLLVVFAAFAGWSIAGRLFPPGSTLLLGLALLVAGYAQFDQRETRVGSPTVFASAMSLYRSPSPFLVFAFATWMSAPLTAGAGALAGIAVAVTVGSLDLPALRTVRICAGIILCLTGIFAALSGLRLV